MRLVNQSTRAHIRTLTILAAATSLLLTLVTPFVGTAHALPGNPYVIDGVGADPTAEFHPEECRKDTSVPDDIIRQGAGSPSLNTMHTVGGHIAQDSPPRPTPQTDMCDIWFDTQVVASGDVFLYFAWDRYQATGTQVVYLELQHKANLCIPITNAKVDCNPFAGRAVGDLLLAFEFHGNTSLDVSTRTWTGSSFTPPTPASLGTVYDSAVSTDGFFGEAAINLTAMGIFPGPSDPFECVTFSQAMPFSVTSLSDTADLKDIVLAALPPITNCGSLTVTKQVQNGVFYGQGFDVQVSGGNLAAPATESLTQEEPTLTVNNLQPGAHYTVSETVPPGWEIVGIVCGSLTTDTASLANIPVEAGEVTTCTVTNSPTLPTLTVIKQVINDDGGTMDADKFPVKRNGNPVDLEDETPEAGYHSQASWTGSVSPGTHTITEDAVTGYELVSIDCGNDSNAVTLDLGESATCTVINDDEAAGLILEKVIFDEDNLYPGVDEDDFEPTIGGSAAQWGNNEVAAGTYTVGEQDADGSSHLADGTFVLSSIVCDGVTTAEVTLGNGESKTCTITNTAVGAGVTVIKDVTNNWGGELGASDFGLTVDGEAVESDHAITLPAGTYTIAEEQQEGYELVSTSCMRGEEAVDGITGESFEITAAPGEAVVCTFVNRDVPGSLAILKDVVNDDGGDATQDDFTPTLDGEATDWGSQDETIGEQTGTAWGTYTIGEDDLPAGYVMTDIDCGEFGSLADDESTVEVTIAAGDEVTCTITNDDQPATLTLAKTVVNDDGGTLEADDFPVFVNDDEVAWETEISIPAGEHTVSEEQQPGYLALGWGGDCAADGTLNAEVGGSYVCTITNDDLPAGLTIVKEILIGDLEPEDFPLLITDGDGATQTVSSGQVTTLPAGTYTIGEEQQEDYELVSIICDNGVVADEGEETVTVSVGLDETVVCTITNAEVQVLPEVELLPEVEELPATGLYTIRLAMLSALIAALGALFLLGTSSSPATGRRRRD